VTVLKTFLTPSSIYPLTSRYVKAVAHALLHRMSVAPDHYTYQHLGYLQVVATHFLLTHWKTTKHVWAFIQASWCCLLQDPTTYEETIVGLTALRALAGQPPVLSEEELTHIEVSVSFPFLAACKSDPDVKMRDDNNVC
jgi:hypothetical protein